MDNKSAIKYLELLLNRTFRAHTSDGRMFLGEFKCTDNVLRPHPILTSVLMKNQEMNIILAKTYEYRLPTEKAKKEAIERQKVEGGAGKADMTSRFLGLVVVPGQHIIKLEVEENKPWELPLQPG